MKIEIPTQPLSKAYVDSKASAIQAHLEKEFRRKRFNGVALVAEKGQIIYEGAFGYADLKTKEPLALNSSFQLSSVSKPFTAMGALILKERGLLLLDAPVQAYLPDFPYEKITVRHLLRHRSGLPRYMWLADQNWDQEIPISNQEMLGLFCDPVPDLYFRPGSRFNYINTNYAMLALVIEAISEQPFDDFLKENIFDPLGMENTLVYNGIENSEIANEVPGHKYWWNHRIRAQDFYLNGVMGDKGIYSTVRDMFKFDQALNNESLVSNETLEEAFDPVVERPRKKKMYYGLGWRIKHYPDEKLVFHKGWWFGFKSCFMRYLNEERTIIILTNKENHIASAEYIRQLFYPSDQKEKPKPVRLIAKSPESENKADSSHQRVLETDGMGTSESN